MAIDDGKRLNCRRRGIGGVSDTKPLIIIAAVTHGSHPKLPKSKPNLFENNSNVSQNTRVPVHTMFNVSAGRSGRPKTSET